MTLYYRIREAIYAIRCKCQRFKRGYSYVDVWNIDFWFINTVKSMLIHLKENGCSYPIEFKDRDEWCAVLDEMVECLEFMDEDNVREFLGFDDIEGWKRMERGDFKRINDIMVANKNRFFILFNKHFYDLWN